MEHNVPIYPSHPIATGGQRVHWSKADGSFRTNGWTVAHLARGATNGRTGGLHELARTDLHDFCAVLMVSVLLPATSKISNVAAITL